VTWIKTIPPAEADRKLREAFEGERALYPREYAQRVLGLLGTAIGATRPAAD